MGIEVRYLIDCKSPFQLDGTDCRSWDVFISAFNDSERVRTVFTQVRATCKYWLILPEYGYRSEELPGGNVLVAADSFREDEAIVATLGDILDKLKNATSICIDVTGMMRPHILFLMYYLKQFDINRIDMVYTEPLHYRRKEDTSFASEDVTEVRQVAGYEGNHSADMSADVLIIGVGYDHHLISHVIESKAGARLVQLHSLPSLSADMYQESLLRLDRVSSSSAPAMDEYQVYSSANDPFLTATTLAETITRLQNRLKITNLYLSPLATKPQVIGFGIYYLNEQLSIPASMIFPYSSRYHRETSKGVGRAWVYPITL